MIKKTEIKTMGKAQLMELIHGVGRAQPEKLQIRSLPKIVKFP